MSIEIHNSEITSFLQCRRKWNWQSPNRRALRPAGESNVHLWFGSMIHFALEDFFGHNKYQDAKLAFAAACYATRRQHPPEAKEHFELGKGMLDHLMGWNERFGKCLKTFWMDDYPYVEVPFKVNIPGVDPELATFGGTFDRIVTDEHDRFWILDWKTAQRFNTSKLSLDPQVSRYCWAFRETYGVSPEGMVYVQMLKEVASPPTVLKNGDISASKAQNTTYALYRKALIERYGNSVKNIPPKCLELASYLRDQETPEGDRFISVSFVRRNEAQMDSEAWKLKALAEEMLRSDLPLIPNPSRDCSWSCPFMGPCIAMEDGSDAEGILANGYERQVEYNPWHDDVPTPEEIRCILNKQSPQQGESQPRIQQPRMANLELPPPHLGEN